MTIEAIEHVVVLMLENRSFDSMLGWLYEKDTPEHFVPASATPPFRGLQSINPNDFINTALGGRLRFAPLRGAQGYTVPDEAPGEEFEHVLTQFYGTPTPAPDAPITMKGVVEDYVQVLQKRGLSESAIRSRASMVMQSFTPSQAPVLNQLARHYAVSDAWYASVPSQTNPNRSFLMCGTSMGMVNNGDLEVDERARLLREMAGIAIGDDRVKAPTIFNALHAAKIDWSVFYQTSYLPQKMSVLLQYQDALLALLSIVARPLYERIKPLLDRIKPYTDYLMELTSGKLESCYTWRLFPHIKDKIPNAAGKFHKMEQFHHSARAGRLPKFSYIEPFWSVSHSTNDNPTYQKLIAALGNDYHPPGSVLAGEQLVKDVYTSLISNKAAWNKTLLLITFDEFVGVFDHQTADLRPGVVRAPGPIGAEPQPEASNRFRFDRLGARVPTILVSPYVKKGTVFRSPTQTPFDHTSVLASTLRAIGRTDLLEQFGARARAAPTYNEVLTLNTPRTDAAALAFLDTARAIGDPVLYGQTLYLKNQNGEYLGAAQGDLKFVDMDLEPHLLNICVDLEIAAYFPTLGQPAKRAPLAFIAPRPNQGPDVRQLASVLVVSREASVGNRHVLGAWEDSHDCYYHNQYLDGPDQNKQLWAIQKLDARDQPLRYGDRIYLVNRFHSSKRLTKDGKWLTTDANGDFWTVEPGPVQA